MRTCFVATNSRVNLNALRSLLEEEGFRLVLWTDAIFVPGKTGLEHALKVIEEANVVLGVLVGDPADRNALYELGVASALGKSIVLWVDDEADVPSDLQGLPTIKFAPEASGSLRFALRHASQQDVPLDRPKESSEAPRREIRRAQRRHEDLALWLAEVFRQEGATVVEGQEGLGSDFALWLPDLEPSVGNPFLVEVKHSIETERAFESAAGQVRHYLNATGGRWGMLVYRVGPPGIEIDPAHGWPMVLALRADELEAMLESATFAEVVHRLRNERAHGAR